MCGICGIFGFSDDFDVSQETVVAMRDTLVHRGPDDADAWSSPKDRITLGHRRLSIIDLSPAGRQPMANETGEVWIVYNGEVYNHQELRRSLEGAGHRYRSHTDSETILHLYEEVGPACVEQLDGMFAFAIWDGRRRELFMARDRLGVKPLYYKLSSAGLLFASEIRAILEHPAVMAELDEEAFFHYLTFAFVPSPSTMYSGIAKLAPAERMIVKADGAVERELYWSPFSAEAQRTVRDMSPDHAAAEVLALLRQSVQKRMMSDVPFGVFLSGGVDSSTNVALMAEVMSEPVRTYSIAPKRYSSYDELDYARLVAERFGTDHQEVRIDMSDLNEFLPMLPIYQDEPLGDWTGISQYFVTRLARDTGTIVVQVGEGADEIFHGYRGYAQHRYVVAPFQRLLPRPARIGAARLAHVASYKTGRFTRHADALHDAAPRSIPYRGGALCLRGPLKDEIALAGHRRSDSYTIPERHWRDAEVLRPGADILQKMSYLELKQRLSELLLMRMDRVTMACSVEAREPFLDHRLVELVMALPPRLKYRRGEGKVVLKRAVRDLLPLEVTTRKKQGFGTPVKEWMRDELGDEARRAIFSSGLRERGLLAYEPIGRLFSEHRSGRADWSWQLWNLYNVSRWYDYWIDGKR